MFQRLLASAVWCLLSSVAAGWPSLAAVSGPQPDWRSILMAPAPKLPPPHQDTVQWRSNLWKALKEARQADRPLFVTLRCLPCKQCVDFDQDVLEGGPELTPLLRQFVTVRLTNAEDIELRLFRPQEFQDFDLSWWGYFLSPEGRIYGIFGGRDEESDSSRISVAALANTLRRVLAHHYQPQRSSWNIDGPAPDLGGRRLNAFDLPGWKSWQKQHVQEKQGCLHCHQMAEVVRQPALDAGTFDKERDLQIWPLPENAGLTLDRHHGLRVLEVRSGSPAEKTGLQPQDELAVADGRRLFGQADFRGVLHRGPAGKGSVELHWLRSGEVMSGRLDLTNGWRVTVLDWRMSVSQGNVGANPGFFPIPGPSRGGARTARPFFGPNPKGPAYQAGLRPHHVILQVDGDEPPGPGRPFLVWFRMRYEPGDSVTLTVDDHGTIETFTYSTAEPRP